MAKLLDLNGNVLSDFEDKEIEAKLHINKLMKDVLPAMQKEAWQKRAFGLVEYATFEKDGYLVEYCFREDDAVPAMICIFFEGAVFGLPFMELLFATIELEYYKAVKAQNEG